MAELRIPMNHRVKDHEAVVLSAIRNRDVLSVKPGPTNLVMTYERKPGNGKG